MTQSKLEAVSQGSSLGETVYQKILLGISDMTLKPGQRITQEELADVLNVSRQPVGPALLLLEHQGFVEPFGRRGRIVADVNESLIMGTAQVLAALDSYAIVLAARDVSQQGMPDGLAQVLALEKLEPGCDAAGIHQLVSKFFLGFYGHRSREQLQTIAEPLWIGYRRFLILVERAGETGLFDRMFDHVRDISKSVIDGGGGLLSQKTRQFHEQTAADICRVLLK